jgi:hypothetical protein
MGYINFSIIISYLLINYITSNIVVVDTSFCYTSVVTAVAEWWISLLMFYSKYERTGN